MKTDGKFSIFDTGLSPRMVIEASAGTGKTYTIVGIFIRLVIRENIPLDRILVITFTRLAARELKERVLNRLRQVAAFLEGRSDEDDPFLKEVARSCGNPAESLDRVRKAVRNFDDACITTIHGFCQQVLAEESLAAGMPFDPEVSAEDRLLADAAADFWRNFIHENSDTDGGRCYLRDVMRMARNPAELLSILRPVLANPHAMREPAAGSGDPAGHFARLLEIRREAESLWRNEREEILRQMRESDVGGIGSLLDGWAEKMNSFLEGDALETECIREFRYFRPGYFRKKLKKGGALLPEHRFFDLCDSWQTLREQGADTGAVFLQTAAGRIRRLKAERAGKSSVVTYDDLIDTLGKALQEPAAGDRLAARLARRFPFALVDEFQDTDPAQYGILDRIWKKDAEEGSLMLIGDPKQAIYGFRGADLYAYLRARNDVPERDRYSLRENFRSTPAFVEAVNRLFSPEHGTPFLEEEIRYRDVGAGLPDSGGDFLVGGVPPVPLKFVFLDEDGRKGDLRPSVFREVVRQVSELVRDGSAGRARLRDSRTGRMRPLAARDIAILVHSNRDAEILKIRLKEAGVGAVTWSREKVFRTREADRLEQLFAAVLDPEGVAVQVALTTGFFGTRLSGLHAVQTGERAMEELAVRFRKLNDRWHRSGCLAMVRQLLFEYEGIDHLSQLQDSERILTNIRQLTDLSASAEREFSYDPPELLRWFRGKMQEESGDDEELLQLESDENLVRILTVHNSKGLEFPVVFCPSLWEAKEYHKRSRPVEIFHRSEHPFQTVLSLEQQDGERRQRAVQRAHFEEICEEVRKTYVALTRARYECRIFWGATRSCNLSGLGALLQGKKQMEKSIRTRLKTGGKKGMDGGLFERKLRNLAGRHPQLFACVEVEDEGGGEGAGARTASGNGAAAAAAGPVPEQPELSVRIYRGRGMLRPHRALHSFSSLSSRRSVADDEPDYDQHLDEFIDYAAGDPVLPPGSGGQETSGEPELVRFPRGADAGTFIHKLFEHETFDFRNPAGSGPLVRELLQEYGYDRKWHPALKSMLEDVSRADYGELALDRVPPQDMLREMEFSFPVAAPDPDLIRSVVRGGNGRAIPDGGIRHYLTGFIDLVVRQNGRYYILDYKSNYLGESPGDYHPEALQEEMLSAGYDMQYHLYTAALCRYLESRDLAFDYRTGFGGVYYLFVRGMCAGSGRGIYYDRPAPERMEKLAEVLDRS